MLIKLMICCGVKMAHQVINKKQFAIIYCTLAELNKIEMPQPFAMCGRCGKAIFEGYVPCVLGHRLYCRDCCKKWVKRATVYEEDKWFEQRVFDEYKAAFIKNNLWKGIKNDI